MKLAVIGANEPLLPFYEQARNLGYEIHAFAWEEGAVCKKYAHYFYPISFVEKESILKKCQEIGIDGITSFSLESALPTVVYVAEKMDLVSNSTKTLHYTGDKFEMRQICEENGIKMLNYWLISSEADLDTTSFPYPIIMKPADGGGAKGINLVKTKHDLREAYLNSLSYSRTKKVIAEDFIEGVEASAVFISEKGKHYYVTTTDKITSGFPNFVELEHTQPSKLTFEVIEEIKRLVPLALTVLSIENGVTSIDLRVDKDNKPVIIEINPRLGGNMITSHLVKLSTGFDIIKAACEIACGKSLNFPVSMEANNAQVFYYTPYTLWVKAYSEQNPDKLVASRLKVLQDPCKNNLQRSGYIIYSGTERLNFNKVLECL